MYKQQYEKINLDIKRTKRAIISLGCSFVEGQGAVNDDLYTDYEWKFEGLGIPLHLNHLSQEEKQSIVKKYPEVMIDPNGNLNFRFMEYNNAFVNVLCSKYFGGSYAAINLGIRGCGNRATIKDLYFYPELHWEDLQEIIVIYCPSGLERFDFAIDTWGDHQHWRCMWPHWKSLEPGPRQTLWKGYSECLWSEPYEVMEQIAHVQELITWCHNKNARLIITPAFDRRYNREYFTTALMQQVYRTMDGTIVKHANSIDVDLVRNKAEKFADLFPWNNIYHPGGFPTFVDLAMEQESHDRWENDHFFGYLGTGSPEKWITSCAHPSAKAHDLFAKKLYDYISGNITP